jgi:hypothetical protein
MNKIEKNINSKQEQESGFVFGKKNYIVLAAGFALIVIGFILLSGGRSEDPNVFNPEIFNIRRLYIAPIVILLGFVTEIFAIMWRPKSN